MIVLSIVPVLIGPYPSTLAASFLAIVISLIALFKTKIKEKSLVFISLFLPSVTIIIKQGVTINSFFNSYEIAKSGKYDIPSHVAGQMLTSAFNEIGMLIILFGLVLCCVSLMLTFNHEKVLAED